jgi:hypothetical protein
MTIATSNSERATDMDVNEKTIAELDKYLSGFMGYEITEKTDWYLVDTKYDGGIYIMASYTCLSEIEKDNPGVEIEMVNGYGARLSASGYMDCTEYAVFDTAQEAADYLLDAYADYDMG